LEHFADLSTRPTRNSAEFPRARVTTLHERIRSRSARDKGGEGPEDEVRGMISGATRTNWTKSDRDDFCFLRRVIEISPREHPPSQPTKGSRDRSNSVLILKKLTSALWGFLEIDGHFASKVCVLSSGSPSDAKRQVPANVANCFRRPLLKFVLFR